MLNSGEEDNYPGVQIRWVPEPVNTRWQEITASTFWWAHSRFVANLQTKLSQMEAALE